MHRNPLSRALLPIVVLVAAFTPLAGRHGTALALSIGGVTPATFASGLGTGPATVDTSVGTGTVSVTAIGSWKLRVSGSDGGKLRRANTCTQGSLLLSNPLMFYATGAPTNFGTSGTPLILTGSPQLAAQGSSIVTVTETVTLRYRYTPSSADQLAAACAYSESTTVDVSAT